MAIFNIYDSANNLSYSEFLDFGLEDVTVTTQNANTIAGQGGGFFVSMSGVFQYDHNGLSGGQLHSLLVSYGGQLVAQVTGWNHDIATLMDGSPAAFERYLLSGNDTINSAYRQGDLIHTHGGDDIISVGPGDDIINGGSGTDTVVLQGTYDAARITGSISGIQVISGSGKDLIHNIELLRFQDKTIAIASGNNGNDTLDGDGQSSHLDDFILGLRGDDTIAGHSGNDALFGNAGHDTLLGGQGEDQLTGGSGRDVMKGGHQSDRLYGNKGGDLLLGGYGADVLKGGDGRDRLVGQSGNDVLTGGAKADHFVFAKGAGHDRITDYEVGRDVIEIGRGAQRMSQIDFEKSGSDVILSFADVEITVEDVTLAEMHNASNFLF